MTATTPALPSKLGPYELVERIGRGGMASVFRARDSRRAGAHRWVAVKLIHPHLAEDQAFVDMFLDEARIASEICHPHVCRVFDHGNYSGAYFLTMEHLCGVPLSAVRAHFAPEERPSRRLAALIGARGSGHAAMRAALVAQMLVDACEGLHALHEFSDTDGEPLDIVHRDVSPENLFLTCSGLTKVVDLGTVTARHQLHTSRSGTIKGKLAYLSPELLASHKVDRRADIWALGVIAWELLTGERLFKRPTEAATLQAVLQDPIRVPSKVRRDVPASFDAAVARALSRDPKARYDSARGFGRALRQAALAAGVVPDAGEVQRWLCEELGHAKVCRHHGRQIDHDPPSECTVTFNPTPTRPTPTSPTRPHSVREVEPAPWRLPSRQVLAAIGAALCITTGWASAGVRDGSAPIAGYALGSASDAGVRVLGEQLSKLLADRERRTAVLELKDSDDQLVMRVPLDDLLAEQVSAASPGPSSKPAVIRRHTAGPPMRATNLERPSRSRW